MKSQVRRFAMLEFVVLTIGAFFWTVCYGFVKRYGSARMRYESDRTDVIGPLGSRCWTLALSVGLFQLMEEYDADPVMGLLAIERANEIDFGAVKERGWFLFNFEDGIA